MTFLLETLHLLYWLYFKPRTLARYVNALEPDLKGNRSWGFSLWQARHRLPHNPRLQRLLLQALLLMLTLPWPVALLVAWATGSEVNWWGVAFGVMFGVVVSVVTGMAFGVSGGVAFGVASGVAVSVTTSMAASGVTLAVAIGVTGSVAGGVAGGVVFGLLFGIAAGVAVGLITGVVNLTVGVAAGVVVGITSGGSVSMAVIASYFRFHQYPFQLLFTWMLYGLARVASPAWAARLLHIAPHQWDELIWFPLFGLAGLARQAAQHDLQLGLAEIAKLADTLGQRGQANRALADVTADVLAGMATLPALMAAPERITWLPQDLKAVRPDLPEVIPALFALARDLQTASDSPLAQRAALHEAVVRVDVLGKRLPYLGREGRERWEPVLAQWNKVLVEALQNVAVPAVGQVENPYEVGNPLPPARKALFKGRTELRDSVITALRQQGRVTLALTGPRRMGKTTFLLQLPALLPSRAIPIYLDVQRPAHTLSDAAFLHALAAAIASGARPYRLIFDPPVRAAFDASPFEAFAQWLATNVYPRLQDFTLLLTLDEFEKAGAALAAQRLTPALFDELRHLIQHQPRLALLFAGVQTLDELGPQWSSYFPNLRQLTIGHLAPAEAEELLRRPDATVEFPLTYSDDAVAHILAQTAGHPYLVQLLGSCVVEEVNRRQVLHADLAIVQAAETLALERGAPFFRNVWDEFTGATPAQVAAGRALLLALARGETFSVSPHAQRLQRYGLLTSAHTLTIPLIARWVRERGEIGD